MNKIKKLKVELDALKILNDELCVENAWLKAELDTAEQSYAESEMRFEEAENIRVEIRYWFHNVLYLHQPMHDPRKILLIIEGVLRK